MRYIVNINPITNLSNDENFFFGTGFLGAEFSTKKELIELLHKYAIIKKNGVRYWPKYIRLSFSPAKEDPFYGIRIYYRPTGWFDENGNVFRFMVEKGEKLIPNYGRLFNILKELGIEIEQ